MKTTLALLLLLCLPAYSYKMASIGNSITHGTFSNSNGVRSTSLPKERDISPWKKLLLNLISRGDYSFSTGTKVNSHCLRIRKIATEEVECKDFSFPGDTIEDMFNYQLRDVLKYNPDYVTMEIGPNDISVGTTPDQFDYFVKKTMDYLNDGSRVIVLVALADYPWLGENLADKRSTFRLKCSTVWKIMDTPKVFIDPSYAEETRKTIALYNKSLELVAKGEMNVFYTSKSANLKFETRDVSGFDCFHPSKNGHEKLAALTWPFSE